MNARSAVAVMWMTATTAIFVAGCDSAKTETGYTPRRVGMGNAEIRTLYAPAFSPEAHTEEKKSDVSAHRPGT